MGTPTTPKATVLLTVKLPAEERAALHEAAAREDLTGSQVIRRFVREYIARTREERS